MARAKEGIIGGAGVVLGKGISRAVPTLIGQSRTGVLGIVISGLAGIFLSPIVKKIGGSDLGTGFLYGAFAAPIESFVVGMNIPILSPSLSSYADELAAIPYQPGALRGQPDGMGFTTLNPGFEDLEEQAVM